MFLIGETKYSTRPWPETPLSCRLTEIFTESIKEITEKIARGPRVAVPGGDVS